MSLLHIAGGATEDKLYPEDVFSTYLYTGNGSTQTINNGIDLAGKGGLVWTKDRTITRNNDIEDTVRGATKSLFSNLTDAEFTNTPAISSFSSTGYTIGGNGGVSGNYNTNGNNYVSWTFRKAPKFFDVVTYTGNGVAGRQIPHNLGCEVGMIVVKKTSAVQGWYVYYKDANGKYLQLESTNANGNDSGVLFGNDTIQVAPTSAVFTLGSSTLANGNGASYVAYLFAHDPSADGIIQCGSFTDAGSGATITLGWEPQYFLYKRVSSSGDWVVHDSMRGFPVGSSSQAQLYPNLPNAETLGGAIPSTSATGVSVSAGSGTFIYLAIRRPMKVPTSGTEVYNAIARTGTGAAEEFNVGLVPDLIFAKNRPTSGSTYWNICDRLRAFSSSTAGVLSYNATASEYSVISSNSGVLLDGKTSKNVQYTTGSNNTNITSIDAIHHFFKRAPKFMDIVCYTGTGVARTVNHNLRVVPELMIVKSRSESLNWMVFSKDLSITEYMQLNANFAKQTNATALWNNTPPNSTLFSVGAEDYNVNNSGQTYVAYLFSTLAGVSKVGSYTGNGSSQTINCGFSAGARFVLSKAVSTTGNWNIGDSVRGITSGNDPLLCLNTAAAEVTTDDWLDPSAEGFIVNETASAHANTNGVTYIYLAIA